MPQLLSVSRAARLVGVSRGAIQKKIRDGILTTFEGKVYASDVLRVYPNSGFEQDKEFIRVTEIKDKAFAKRVREHVLPDAEVLFARLGELSQELADTKAQVGQYKKVLSHLNHRIASMVKNEETANVGSLQQLSAWLRQTMLRENTRVEYPRLLVVKDSLLRIMTAQVRMMPSEHEFFVEGVDTVLDSALRSGFSPPYGCNDGSCGKCKARIVSGQIKKVRDYSFYLSEEEQINGAMLMCCNTAVSDLELEVDEALSARDIEPQRIEVEVRRIERPSVAMCILDVRPPKSRRLQFLSGQKARITLAGQQAAEYPIASCPCDERTIQFHIPQIPETALSKKLFDSLTLGERALIEGPSGQFTLRTTSTRPLLFVAYETGFASIKSLIEQAMALDAAESMQLYWLVDEPSGLYQHNLCRAWSDALDNFRYLPLIAQYDEKAANTNGISFAFCQRAAQTMVADITALSEHDVYLSGPEAVVEIFKKALSKAGVDLSRIIASD